MPASPKGADAVSTGPGTLYTAGYGNKPPEQFAALVATRQIDRALDARLIPSGWHADYRGKRFLALLRTAGAKRAQWAGRLGNPAKRDGGEMRIADPAAIDDLVAVLRAGENVLVICGCLKVDGCHRRLIAELVTRAAPEITVEHLTFGPADNKA